jgi:uncharacterized protein (DUF1501 family)
MSVTTRYAFASPEDPTTGDVIVVVFLRGGADGLSLVAPYDMTGYRNLRPNIRVKSPSEGDATNRALPLVSGGNIAEFPLSGTFGFHPAMSALHAGPWTAGKLAIVHAAGMPASESDTRSHFDSMRNWESGTANYASSSGFMNRFLTSQGGAPRIGAVSIGGNLPRSLAGPQPAFATPSAAGFGVSGFSNNNRALTAFRSFYAGGTGSSDALLSTGANTLGAVDLMKTVTWTAPQFDPQNGAVYPTNSAANAFKEVARMIRGNVGLRVAAIDIGGWDTHDTMGLPGDPASYFHNKAQQFSEAMTAFATDLGALMDEVTLMTMSEFGRTIKENGSGGTDHGRGSVQFVMGNKVRGGIYGDFVSNIAPGPEGDLAVLNDYRRAISEVLSVRGGATDLATVFPTYTQQTPFGLCVP